MSGRRSIRDQAYIDSGIGGGTLSVVGQVLPADLAIAINGPNTVTDNTSFNEAVTVTDRGRNTANTVTNILVPTGLGVVSAPGATLTSGTLIWRDSSLAAGESVVHHVTFHVNLNSPTSLTPGGVTESSTPDPILSDNVALATLQVG